MIVCSAGLGIKGFQMSYLSTPNLPILLGIASESPLIGPLLWSWLIKRFSWVELKWFPPDLRVVQAEGLGNWLDTWRPVDSADTVPSTWLNSKLSRSKDSWSSRCFANLSLIAWRAVSSFEASGRVLMGEIVQHFSTKSKIPLNASSTSGQVFGGHWPPFLKASFCSHTSGFTSACLPSKPVVKWKYVGVL